MLVTATHITPPQTGRYNASDEITPGYAELTAEARSLVDADTQDIVAFDHDGHGIEVAVERCYACPVCGSWRHMGDEWTAGVDDLGRANLWRNDECHCGQPMAPAYTFVPAYDLDAETLAEAIRTVKRRSDARAEDEPEYGPWEEYDPETDDEPDPFWRDKCDWCA